MGGVGVPTKPQPHPTASPILRISSLLAEELALAFAAEFLSGSTPKMAVPRPEDPSTTHSRGAHRLGPDTTGSRLQWHLQA